MVPVIIDRYVHLIPAVKHSPKHGLIYGLRAMPKPMCY